MPRQIRITSATVAALVALVAIPASLAPALAVEIEGVQPAALDQPRVHVCFRRDAKGKPLIAADNGGGGGGAAGIAKALGLGAGDLGGGAAQPFDVQAFLDTGASGVLLSKNTAAALGVRKATAPGGKELVFHDVGVGGGESFAVSEPLFVAVAPGGGVPTDPADYSPPFRPVRAQVNTGGGLVEQLTGGLDVVGMPAMKGKIVVFDPRPVDTFADTMHADLLDPRRDRPKVPKPDHTVALSYASFARFTHTEPAGVPGPNLADNPFVGPNPTAGEVAKAGSKAQTTKAAVPPVLVMLNGKQSTGSWLFDTGAAASMISSAQAKRLGVTYRAGTENTGAPVLEGVPQARQFTFAIGGIGGQKTSAGFYLDTLTLPTREGDPVVYKGAPVLVSDITVEDPATHEKVTLDGVLGMNFFVASADVKQTGMLPDVNQLTAGPYQAIVFDEPAGTLGLKLKPEFAKGNGAKRGTVDIKPARSRGTR